MIQKCANPGCNIEFRYAGRGHLFSFEIRHPTAPCHDVPKVICEKNPSHATIHFWLCESCSRTYSLHFTNKTGLSLVPREKTPTHVRNAPEPPERSASPRIIADS